MKKGDIMKLEGGNTQKEIQVDGVIGVPENVDIYDFFAEFLEWLESKDCYFGGCYKEFKEEV